MRYLDEFTNSSMSRYRRLSQSLEEVGERLYLGIDAVGLLDEFAKSSILRYRELSQYPEEEGERLYLGIEAVC